jgi:hypothetical protein
MILLALFVAPIGLVANVGASMHPTSFRKTLE